MERVFAGLTFLILLIYLDYIIVYSKTSKEHLENLKVVLERLKNANLKLNPKKCNLLCTKVAFLGHYELVSKFSVGLKTLLHQGLSEPEFYDDLVNSKKM